MKQFNEIYVSLDVHKDTIAVAIARGVRTNPHYFGAVPNTPAAVNKLLKQLSPKGEVLSFSDEAGPCGYELYQQLTKIGHVCDVEAPSLIPRKPGVRIKTDRREAVSLAKLYASGSLTPVWVPGKEQVDCGALALDGVAHV